MNVEGGVGLVSYAIDGPVATVTMDDGKVNVLSPAMLVALNRPDELRMHIRAAFNVGVTRDQIREVFLQTAIYCGVPAANSAFHTAQEVFAEMDAKP